MTNKQVIKEQENKYGELCGVIFTTDKDLAVFYKKYDFDLLSENSRISANNKARFILAHGLAHCVLHPKYLNTSYLEFRHDNHNINNEPIKVSTYEYQANIYASQLLIPEKKLFEVISKLIIPTVESLCQLFQVSPNVMIARLNYLNIHNIKNV